MHTLLHTIFNLASAAAGPVQSAVQSTAQSASESTTPDAESRSMFAALSLLVLVLLVGFIIIVSIFWAISRHRRAIASRDQRHTNTQPHASAWHIAGERAAPDRPSAQSTDDTNTEGAP